MLFHQPSLPVCSQSKVISFLCRIPQLRYHLMGRNLAILEVQVGHNCSRRPPRRLPPKGANTKEYIPCPDPETLSRWHSQVTCSTALARLSRIPQTILPLTNTRRHDDQTRFRRWMCGHERVARKDILIGCIKSTLPVQPERIVDIWHRSRDCVDGPALNHILPLARRLVLDLR